MSKRSIPGDSPEPDEIGQAGWTTLHTIAAAFPHHPTEAQRGSMRTFLSSWSQVYSCGFCAAHMRQAMTELGPTIPVDSKSSLSTYVCKLHNSVNRQLGKREEDCSPESVLRRWHPTFPYMDDEIVIADDETDPIKVLTRLKRCQAFCPKEK